jgi:putative (di)nucleoside polyphosphate hydrolase
MRRAMKKRYRPNVAAIIRCTDGRVLLGQRADYPQSWQFPQGGIDPGESRIEALRREVLEETGLAPEWYDVREERGPYRYDFPGGADHRGHHGQEQWYFLCLLRGAGTPAIDLAATCGEFTGVLWTTVDTFPLERVPPMKREVYRRVLQDFFRSGGN